MILNYKVRNFLSIKDEQTLSFEATSENKYNEYYIVDTGKYKILKMGALYGANASGKTNILKALDLLRTIATRSREIDSPIQYSPFKFDPEFENGNCNMELHFVIEEDNKYIEHFYEIEFNQREIIKETLTYYPSTQPALIYERKKDDNKERNFSLKLGKRKMAPGEQNVLESATLPNTSILSSFNKINPVFPLARRVRDWFVSHLLPVILPESNLTKYSFDYFNKSTAKKQVLNQILNNSDFNINQIIISEKEEEFTGTIKSILDRDGKLELTEEVITELGRMQTMKRQFISIDHNVIDSNHESDCELPLEVESNGTKRSFGLSAPIINSLVTDKCLVIDEIESSLHFELMKYFILVFLANSNNSQMIFSTHNLLLLDWEVIRNDVIWFTEKRKDASTELYSLAEFKGLNRSSIFRKYMSGQFGAKPNIYDYKLDINSIREEENGKEN